MAEQVQGSLSFLSSLHLCGWTTSSPVQACLPPGGPGSRLPGQGTGLAGVGVLLSRATGKLSPQSLPPALSFTRLFGKVCVKPRITSCDSPSRQRPAEFSQGSGGGREASLYFSLAVAGMQSSGREWVLETTSRSPHRHCLGLSPLPAFEDRPSEP